MPSDPQPQPRVGERPSGASDPGRFALSMECLSFLLPEERRNTEYSRLRREKLVQYLQDQLDLGDSRAAVVVSESPCLIAAYSDEFDAVIVLRYEEAVRQRYGLTDGARLVAVFFYGDGKYVDSDILLGPSSSGTFASCHPQIADLLSDDVTRIIERKTEIDELEWERAEKLGREYLRLRPGVARDGRPLKAGRSAMRGRESAEASDYRKR